MTKTALRDKAYLLATGNHLSDSLDYQEFQDISEENLMKMVWEPLEYWAYKTVVEHIVQIADGIIRIATPDFSLEQEYLQHLHTDLNMLLDGTWEPDDDSVQSSIDSVDKISTSLGIKLKYYEG